MKNKYKKNKHTTLHYPSIRDADSNLAQFRNDCPRISNNNSTEIPGVKANNIHYYTANMN